MSMYNVLWSPSHNLAFCDGACKGNQNANAKGGYGAVIISHDKKVIKVSGGEYNTTNNRMELMAAIMVLEFTSPDIPLRIKSDSNYVVNGITNWIDGWIKKNWKDVKNVELWQRLYDLSQNRVISWEWVKGHNGDFGNETADELANLGVFHQRLNVNVTELNV